MSLDTVTSKLWAKSGPPFSSRPQLLLTHAVVSGVVAQIIYREYLCDGIKKKLRKALHLSDHETECVIGYSASLHDIGKAEFSFQSQAPNLAKAAGIDMNEIVKPNVRHEKTGRDALNAIWKDKPLRMRKLFTGVVGAHHQDHAGVSGFWQGNKWSGYQAEIENAMRERFLGDINVQSFDKIQRGFISAELLGLTILSDWIASSDIFSDADDWINRSDAEEIIRKRTAKFLAESHLKPVSANWPTSFDGLWSKIIKGSKRPLQASVENILNNSDGKKVSLILIEAPMGEGKTEAGLFAATRMAKQWEKDGVYMALPTAATSTQMVGRVQEMLNANGVNEKARLLHSMAWLSQPNFFSGNSAAETWLKPSNRSLLGQFAVGTIDQAMLAATAVNYGVMRLMGIGNKALLIDEIHAYDAFMDKIIVNLLKWCKALDTPVVLLSATLPPRLKEKLLAPYASQSFSSGYPLITCVYDDGSVLEEVVPETSHKMVAEIELRPFLQDKKAIAEMVVRDMKNGGNACVIMNTIEEAKDVYREIKKLTGDTFLFHSRYLSKDRSKIESRCFEFFGKDKSHRPKCMILVATQVIEQSLDVDFDRIYTAVAPIDLVIQRLGRLFRHDETPRPEHMKTPKMIILTPDHWGKDLASSYVYPECLLRSAVRVLSGKKAICVPEDIEPLVAAGYDPDSAPVSEAEKWAEKVFADSAKESAGCAVLLSEPQDEFTPFQTQFLRDEDSESIAIQTRLGPPSLRVALVDTGLYKRLESKAVTRDGEKVCVVNDEKTAEVIMLQSVSLPKRMVGGQAESYGLLGGGLISGTRIYPAENGKCQIPGGKTIAADPEYGVCVE